MEEKLRYRLFVVPSEGDPYSVDVGKDPVSIGRSADATVSIDEEAVSRRHCLIISWPGRLMLLDQGSTNGTTVNGKRVNQERLKNGDIVQILRTQIRVVAEKAVSLPTSKTDEVDTWRDPKKRECIPSDGIPLLEKLGKRLSRVETTTGAADILLDALAKVFPSDRAYVLDHDLAQPREMDKIISSRGHDANRDGRFGPSPRVIHSVLKSGQIEHHQSFSRHKPATSPDVPEEETASQHVTHVICAPFHLGGRSWGLIYLEVRNNPGGAPSKETLELVSTMAHLASPAMSLGRLREENQAQKSGSRRVREARPPSGIRRKSPGLGVGTGEVIGRSKKLEAPSISTISGSRRADIEIIEEQRIELAAQLAELEHLQTSRARTARWLVHDIKNLVLALDGNLYLIGEMLSHADMEQEPLENARACSHQILSMSQDVLDVQQMEEGAHDLNTTRIELGHLIRAATERYIGHATQKRIKLWDASSDDSYTVIADYAVVSRVLDNLVENALKHAGSGGWVKVTTQRTPGAARIVVADSGPSVPPNLRDRVFEEWYKSADSDRRHHGIGLHFCRLAVEAHGGSIHIEGTEGNNRFIVTLPAMGDRREPSTVPPGEEDTIV